MCGVIGYVGQPPGGVIYRLVKEAEVRGLHNLGSHLRVNCGVYHCRYITSGGAHQPLFRDGYTLAFNGVIDMGTKKEMETKYNCKLFTDNDGELLLALNETPEEMIKFIDNPAITFAGVLIYGNRFYAFRNKGRPLWKKEADGYVLIASTNDIFKRAGVTGAELLEPLKLYQWTF